MNLTEVNTGVQKNRKGKRLGRGKGTGQGKTGGRGHKGAGSRAGFSMPAAFEGGQMPLVRRIPKRGFNNTTALEVATVNVGDIELLYEDGEIVTIETLKEKGILKFRYDVLKILGDGELTKKVKVVAHRVSNTAKIKIEASGSTLEILPGIAPVVKFQAKENKARKPRKS